VEVETENEVKNVENEVENEEITVSFVEEWKISDAEISNWTTIHWEQEIGLKKLTKWTKYKKSKVIWDIGWTKVEKPVWRIKFEAQVAPYPLFMLPEDIRKYLIKKWFNSEIYKKDKEWLEKHNVDMEIVEKLKQFLTERL
jgi:hypothetical protein